MSNFSLDGNSSVASLATHDAISSKSIGQIQTKNAPTHSKWDKGNSTNAIVANAPNQTDEFKLPDDNCELASNTVSNRPVLGSQTGTAITKTQRPHHELSQPPHPLFASTMRPNSSRGSCPNTHRSRKTIIGTCDHGYQGSLSDGNGDQTLFDASFQTLAKDSGPGILRARSAHSLSQRHHTATLANLTICRTDMPLSTLDRQQSLKVQAPPPNKDQPQTAHISDQKWSNSEAIQSGNDQKNFKHDGFRVGPGESEQLPSHGPPGSEGFAPTIFDHVKSERQAGTQTTSVENLVATKAADLCDDQELDCARRPLNDMSPPPQSPSHSKEDGSCRASKLSVAGLAGANDPNNLRRRARKYWARTFLSLSLLCEDVQAALTAGGTVTADSLLNGIAGGKLQYTDATYGIQTFGFGNLVNGQFNPKDFDDWDHTVSMNAWDGGTPKPTSCWFNIKMSDFPSEVWSVIVINCESYGISGTVHNRIIGTDFWVGNDENPLKNTRCNANPRSTGVYSCNGLVGMYLGIGEDKAKTLNISQIRAYSYKLNGHQDFDFFLGDPYSIFTGRPDPITFVNGPLLSPYSNDSSPNRSFRDTSDPYMEIRFKSARFIQTVTYIAFVPDGSDINTASYRVTVGNETGVNSSNNFEVGKRMTNDDRYGKEFIVKRTALVVAVWKTANNHSYALRGLLVTSTQNDCSGTFDWATNSKSDWPTRITIGPTTQTFSGLIKAVISDCSIAHKASLSNGSALPSFVTYDAQTKTATIKVDQSTPVGSYTIRVTAYTNDKVVTLRNEYHDITFCVAEIISIQVAGSVADTTFEVDPASPSPRVITIPPLKYIPCLTPVPLLLELTNAPLQLPSFIALVNYEIRVTISDPSNTGVYQLSLRSSGGNPSYLQTFTLTLACTITKFFNTAKGVTNLMYTVFPEDNKPVFLVKPLYATEPSYCLLSPCLLALTRVDVESHDAPPFISLTDSNVKVQTNDPADAGIYNLQFIATETRSKKTEGSVVFQITVVCQITDLKPVYDSKTKYEVIYTIRSAPELIALPKYTYKTLACQKKLVYRLENQINGFVSTEYPNFFQFNAGDNTVQLAGDKSHYDLRDKEFKFRLFVQTEDGTVKNSDYVLVVKTLFKNSPPQFMEELIPQEAHVGQKSEWPIPEFFDTDGDEVVSIKLTPMKPYLSLNLQTMKFQFDGTKATNEDDVGQNTIKVTLTDEFGATRIYKQQLYIIQSQIEIYGEDEESASASNSTSESGLANDTSAITESEDIGSIANSTDANNTDRSNSTSSTKPTSTFAGVQINSTQVVKAPSRSQLPPQIKKAEINIGGVVNIMFDQKVQLPLDIFNLTSTNKGSSIFRFKFIQNPLNQFGMTNDDQQSKQQNKCHISLDRRVLQQSEIQKFTWSALNGTSDSLQFDIRFENPSLISKNGPDKMKITLIKTDYIFGVNNKPVDFPHTEIKLPRQLASKREAAAVESSAKTVDSFIKIAMVGNAGLTVFLTTVIFLLWGMINGMQVISLTCLFSVRLPINVFTVSNKISKLASFDVFRTDIWFFMAFRFSLTKSLSPSFEEAQYEGSNFVVGIGPMFLFMVFYTVFLGLRFVLLRYSTSTNRYVLKVKKVFSEHRVEPTIIRFILEGGMDILIWSLISILNIKRTKTFGPKWQDGFSNILAVAMLAALLYAFAHFYIRARQLQAHSKIDTDKLQNDEKKKHEEKSNLLDDLFGEFKDNLPSILFNLLFLLRRLILILTLVFMSGWSNFQIAINILISFAMLNYTIVWLPFQDMVINAQEIINELFVLLSAYWMIVFTDFIPDDLKIKRTGQNLKNQLGIVMLVILGIFVLSNLAVIGFTLFKEFLAYIRKRKAAQKQKKIDQANQRRAENQRIRDETLRKYNEEQEREKQEKSNQRVIRTEELERIVSEIFANGGAQELNIELDEIESGRKILLKNDSPRNQKQRSPGRSQPSYRDIEQGKRENEGQQLVIVKKSTKQQKPPKGKLLPQVEEKKKEKQVRIPVHPSAAEQRAIKSIKAKEDSAAQKHTYHDLIDQLEELNQELPSQQQHQPAPSQPKPVTSKAFGHAPAQRSMRQTPGEPLTRLDIEEDLAPAMNSATQYNNKGYKQPPDQQKNVHLHADDDFAFNKTNKAVRPFKKNIQSEKQKAIQTAQPQLYSYFDSFTLGPFC